MDVIIIILLVNQSPLSFRLIITSIHRQINQLIIHWQLFMNRLITTIIRWLIRLSTDSEPLIPNGPCKRIINVFTAAPVQTSRWETCRRIGLIYFFYFLIKEYWFISSSNRWSRQWMLLFHFHSDHWAQRIGQS